MLHLISSDLQIEKYQSQLEKVLEKALPNEELYTIGYPSGSKEAEVSHNSKIWFSHSMAHTADKRHWNAFGLSKNLSSKKSNSIVVEANILQNGVNGRVAGAFVKDENTGAIYLTHSGKIGGGKKGIGKNSFLKWYKKSIKEVFGENNKSRQAIIIGDITSELFPEKLAKFIKNVDIYKNLVSSGEINQATTMTDKELEEKILNSSSGKKPAKTKNTVSTYDRNKYVVEYAKRRAKGKCQLCLEKAPFKSKSGQPYLEAHHIKWLSKGGDDSINNTVALCPNCHKKMHIVNLKRDIKILKRTIS